MADSGLCQARAPAQPGQHELWRSLPSLTAPPFLSCACSYRDCSCRNWSYLQSRRWREERAGAASCCFIIADIPKNWSFGTNLTLCFLLLPPPQPTALFLTEQKSCLLPSSTTRALILWLWCWIKSWILRKHFQGTVKILFVGV